MRRWIDTFATFEAAPFGIAVWDRQLRYVYVNDALPRMVGGTKASRLGHTVQEAVPDDADRVAPLMRQIMDSGAPVVDQSFPLEGSDGRLRHFRGSFFPLPGDDGRPEGLVAVFGDITEHVEMLAAHDARLILEEVFRVVPVGLVVTWGEQHVVTALNAQGRGMLPARGDVSGRPIVEAFPEIAPVMDRTFDAVVRTGEPVRREALPVAFTGPGSLDGHRHYDAVLSPIKRDEAVVGIAVSFVEVTEQVRRHGEMERRLAAEHRIAERLQQALLPRRLASASWLSLAAVYHPAGNDSLAGGDFYDAFAWGDEAMGLLIGDVSGKGVDAASATGLARWTARAAARSLERPADVLETLNAMLLEELDEDEFCTAALVRLELRADGVVGTVALGGHPPPVLAGGPAGPRTVGRRGTLLGVDAHPSLHAEEFAMATEEHLVLYTDGALEGRAPDVVTPEELAERLRGGRWDGPGSLARGIADAIMSSRTRDDDLAVLVAQALPGR